MCIFERFIVCSEIFFPLLFVYFAKSILEKKIYYDRYHFIQYFFALIWLFV